MAQHSVKILLLEDNPADVVLLREILRDSKDPSFHLTQATRLDEGLALLAKGDFDIVLADLTLPDAHGLETLARLRAASPHMPLVVLTGVDDRATALQAVRDGAQDFLVKGHADDYQIVHALLYAIERRRFVDTERLRPPPLNPERTTAFHKIPRDIAGYEIVKPLGAGSMATVYLVYRGRDEQREYFALKVLRPNSEWTMETREGIAWFLDEAQLAAGIKHPNIVEVVDYGVAEDHFPYIVMEYVQGHPLHRILPELLSLDYHAKTRLLLQVAQALLVIHEHGICHRDVKPSNIMVTNELRVKVMDFGIAKIRGKPQATSGLLAGSPAYMAPEAFDTVEVDHRADLFSFGVLAYELYLGHRPFTGDSLSSIAAQIRRARPSEPRKLAPEFPPDLQSILGRLLKKRAEDRFASAAELVVALEAFLHGRGQATPLLGGLTERFLNTDWA